MKDCCYDCGLKYGGPGWIEAIIPDKIWDVIRPDGCAEHAGLLCITCISRRLEERELYGIPVWLCGTEPIKAMVGGPGDAMRILRNYGIEDMDSEKAKQHYTYMKKWDVFGNEVENSINLEAS